MKQKIHETMSEREVLCVLKILPPYKAQEPNLQKFSMALLKTDIKTPPWIKLQITI